MVAKLGIVSMLGWDFSEVGVISTSPVPTYLMNRSGTSNGLGVYRTVLRCSLTYILSCSTGTLVQKILQLFVPFCNFGSNSIGNHISLVVQRQGHGKGYLLQYLHLSLDQYLFTYGRSKFFV